MKCHTRWTWAHVRFRLCKCMCARVRACVYVRARARACVCVCPAFGSYTSGTDPYQNENENQEDIHIKRTGFTSRVFSPPAQAIVVHNYGVWMICIAVLDSFLNLRQTLHARSVTGESFSMCSYHFTHTRTHSLTHSLTHSSVCLPWFLSAISYQLKIVRCGA